MNISDSSRLSYSLMTRDDAEIMYQIDQDPEVMRFINGGKKTTRDDVKNIYIPRMERYANVDKGWGLWKISTIRNSEIKNSEIKNSEVIGFILVRPMDFFTDSPEYENIELGWRFIKKSWGFGFATEAAEHIMNAMIEKKGIGIFTAIALEENVASIKIMEKIGMKYIKTYVHKDPLFEDEVVYYQMRVK